ncbi:MAG: DUF5010 C-terminal domain-containing protein [bacterium]|nr:DUF5010 C-terminal domain-containing protein [bacterium]
MKRLASTKTVWTVGALLGALAFAGRGSLASRGGWEDPQGGWDYIFEGNALPDVAGFTHDNDSDAWDSALDPNAVKVAVVPGQGDTENGSVPSADATVLLLDDKQTAGENRKFLFTKEVRPEGVTPRLFEVGVSFIARWRLLPPTTSYNNEYGAGNVGVAEDARNDPDWGVGAYYASGTEMGFVPPELGGHPIAIDSSNSFHAVWMTAIYDPANRSNLLVTVYLDGKTTPVATFSQTGWNTASRASVDNVYFGLTRSPYIGAMQLDYIGAKLGVHVPLQAGFRADAGPDQVTYESQAVLLDGTRSKGAMSFSWVQLVQPGDPVVEISDSDQPVASFIAPSLEQGIVLTFQLTVTGEKGTDMATTRVTVRAANPPAIFPPNFAVAIGHLSVTLTWDAILDADAYLLGIASQPPGEARGPYVWSLETGTSYHHGALLPGWTYFYKIGATNSYGEGPESEELSVTALPNLALRPDAQPFSRITSAAPSLTAIHDGQTVTSFYSNDGINYADQDWYGYVWSVPLVMDRLVYYAAENRPDGGWWKSLKVEYSRNGGATWQQPDFVAFSPEYCFRNVPTARRDYARYELVFPPVRGNAVRIIGAPGGSSYYTGVAELEVYEPPFVDGVYVYAGEDQTSVEGKEVTLDGGRTVGAESYLWRQVLLGGEPAVTILDPDRAPATFDAPPVPAETVLTFELTAGGIGGPGKDRVRVRVVRNIPPAAPVWSLVAPGLRTAYLSWQQAAGAEAYSVLRSEIPGGRKTPVGSDLASTEFLDEDAAVGVHFYTVRAANPAGSVDSIEMPIGSFGFADLKLVSRDIGGPARGSTTYDSATGEVTVRADGQDIWDSSDSFRFDYCQLSGDFEVIAKAISLDGPHSWGKLGIMIRDDLTPASVHSYVCSTVMTALSMQGRNVPNSSDQFAAIIDAGAYEFPIHLRLKRQGNTFTGLYRRPDGEWYTFSPQTMVVPAVSDPVFAGVAVTSHQAGTLATAKYSHFVIVGPPGPPAVCFRKLPPSFVPGEPVSVELAVRVDPSRRPSVLSLVETLPEGAIPLDMSGGQVSGRTVTWRFSGENVKDKSICYSVGTDSGALSPLQFSGDIVYGTTRELILGASQLYMLPSPPQVVSAETLLAAHLIWMPNPPEEGVIGYHVYRSENGGEWVKVADLISDTLWTDMNVEQGRFYSYRVTAETASGGESPLELSQATAPSGPTMAVRECEEYNFGGGQSPGGPSQDGVAAREGDDLTSTDYFYQNATFPWHEAKIPNPYRPADAVEIVQGEGASGWSVRNTSPADWFRYGFPDVPEGNVKIVVRAASEAGAKVEFFWDEGYVGFVTVSMSGKPTAWMDYPLEPFPSEAGDHTLRVRMLDGSCNLDAIGFAFGWSEPGTQVIFSEDFESYGAEEEMEAAGWEVISGSGDPRGMWQLWSTEGEPLNLTDPHIPGMTGTYVITDGDLAGMVDLDETLVSPVVDCRGHVNVHLSFSKNINIFEEDPDQNLQVCEADVQVYDEETSTWGAWTWVFHHDRTNGDDSVPEQIRISSIADRKKVRLRWRFYSTYYDYWFALDDIKVSGIPLPPSPGPPIRTIGVAGATVTLSWEAFGSGRYTVQYTGDLTSRDWQNASGSWPISETSWTGDDTTDVPSRFYRILGE